MLLHLAGERFAPVPGGRCLDLATGDFVILRQWPLDDSTAQTWTEARASELGEQASGAMSLIDYGVSGSASCFEARSTHARVRTSTVAGMEQIAVFAQRVVAAAAADRRGGIHVVQIPAPNESSRWEAGSLIARQLRPLGYVTVAAHAALTASILSTLGHRHVVLLCFAAADRERAIDVIRHLGFASARAHLVVDAMEPGAPTAGVVLRERAPVHGFGRDTSHHLRRAGSFQQRRRLAASARCLRAAVASAHRQRDPSTEVRAGRDLLDLLLRRGDWRAARRNAWALARDVESEAHRVDAAGIAARVLIRCADLHAAEIVLATTSAECALRRQTVPVALRLCEVEVCFWQGRLERAITLLDSCADTLAVDVLRWRALIGWATGDALALHRSVSMLSAIRTDTPSPCTVALDWLWRSAIDDQRPDIASALPSMAGACEPDDPMTAFVLEAMATEYPEARAQVARLAEAQVSKRAVTSPLFELILRWMCVNPDHRKPGTELMRDMQRRGLMLLARWNPRRRSMRLSESVPRLLQLVSDADDDRHALTSACAWIREQPGVSAVSVLATGDGRVLCGSAVEALELAADDLQQVVAAPRPQVVVQSGSVAAIAPVRSSGRVIAAIVARGRSDAAETLKEIVDTAAPLCAPAIRARLDSAALAAASDALTPEILGRSPALAGVREAIARAAATAFPVLVEGESGTGKELVARALHRLSARRDRRFCAVNCAALTDELIEAELFGYARGAFTGAIGARAGLFEEAHQGTLFLDEIRELSARAQAKLLRALQEREIRRLGENMSRAVDVRIVAATNQSLGEAASQKNFREDLVFRLAVVRIRMPPLRDRVEDVPLLALAFWRQMAAQTGTHARLGPDALASLSRHAWPGNVRELQNAIAALIVLAPARGRVGARHVRQVLDGRASADVGAVPLDAARRAFERDVIAATLARHGGRRAAAAQELGLTRQGLLKAIRRVGLQADGGPAGVA